MTEQVEKQVLIKVCVKLEHSCSETIWMTQKATAVGNCWLAASSWQCATHVLCLMQSCLAKHQITQVTQHPYSPDLVPCNFWLFPKLKSPLKGKRFQTTDEIQENITVQLIAIGKTAVWGPKVPTLKGLRHHCPVCIVPCIFFNKCLYYSLYYTAGYFMGRPCTHHISHI